LGCSESPAPTPVISGDVSAPAVDANPQKTSTGIITGSMYRLQMPFGANSADPAFWKPLEEDAVDAQTSARLTLNGIRVGRGRVADWPQYLQILERESAIKMFDGLFAGQSVDDVPIDMSDELPEELLSIFDEHGLTMRSFDHCQNRFSFSFQWAPRKPGTIRITVCPVVMVWQMRMDFTMSDKGDPASYRYRENLYDLHLCADIAPGEFMVIGTSPATADPSRVGSRFLTRDGPNQRFEQLLIFVGNPVPLGHIKSNVPAPTTKG